MTFIVVILALYLAANLGANDVANSMGTSVGSKALTLKQALIVAGILEFTGAVLFGGGVSETLATGVINPAEFTQEPRVLLMGMVGVTIACGLWLQIATSKGLPVSSSHAIVGAIAGFGVVAAGIDAINWPTIGTICISWVLTPVVSAIIAASFYSTIKIGILEHSHPWRQYREWIPWLSVAVVGIFGSIVLPQSTAPLARHFGWQLPPQDLPLALGAISTIALTTINLRKWSDSTSDQRQEVEKQLARFQIISACFVAFAHGSNDVGNAIAPLATIVHIQNTGTIPDANFHVPLWILLLGGAGIVTGLGIWGGKVIATIGENITKLQPSSGFCAELATATTVLIASSLGLPVSTSHALVGGVMGIGLVQNLKSIQWQTIQSIILAWVITIPIAFVSSALLFTLSRQI
ncbi:MAG TPA: inorganic phosphate transporter [Oscillatoriaceae cyanobacterium M33_DOE_052]|uniref:Phosphate transporter n=1 Tax=Planktothricoides sp. SpSt-374 TaxID=2282167 RepID=A0A7C3ZHZ0_9CYAN|nr:inorganic phosphate transporter [Oscillatoriaceae cyanobacterium M33_DOE_052]